MITNTLVYSTAASAYFAKLIAKGLGIELGKIERQKFGGVENYYRIGISDRSDLLGKTVVFVASTNTDEDFLEVARVGSALAGYGATRRIFVIPFFGYTTMERAKLPGEVVTAKTNCRILSGIPNSGLGNVFLMLDLHVSGLLHYFEGDCLRYELYGEKVLAKAISDLKFENFMFASADLGRPAWVDVFAKRFGTGIAFVRKTRDKMKTETCEIIGNVRGKHVIIYDDMTRSAGTLVDAAGAYLKKGASGVSAVLSHFALNSLNALDRLLESPLDRIVITNSHPMSQPEAVKNSAKISIVDVSGEFVGIIKKILYLEN